MKKRALLSISVLVLAFILAGCGNNVPTNEYIADEPTVVPLGVSEEMQEEAYMEVFEYECVPQETQDDNYYENGEFIRRYHLLGSYTFNPSTAAWYHRVKEVNLLTNERVLTTEEIIFEWVVDILGSDRRIIEKSDIGIGEEMLFRFDLWEVEEFVYRLAITIMNQNGRVLQQIDGLYQTTSPFTPIEGEGRQPVFVDLNFDGYLDLRIWGDFISERGHGWASHYHFIWDGRQFVQNEEFDALTSVRIFSDTENQTWSFGWSEQAGARQVRETYGFLGGAFVHLGTDDTMHRYIRDGEHDSGWLAIRDVVTFYPFTRHITIYDATDIAINGLKPIQDLGHFQQNYNLSFWRDFYNDGYTDLALGEYIKWVWCPDESLFVIWQEF